MTDRELEAEYLVDKLAGRLENRMLLDQATGETIAFRENVSYAISSIIREESFEEYKSRRQQLEKDL
jgi:hypothetical protein